MNVAIVVEDEQVIGVFANMQLAKASIVETYCGYDTPVIFSKWENDVMAVCPDPKTSTGKTLLAILEMEVLNHVEHL